MIDLAELYSAIYNYILSRSDVAELTVEDPAEAFEDLRDRNDLKMLLGHSRFMEEGFGTVVSHDGGRVARSKTRARATPMGIPSATAKSKGKGKMGPPVDKAWAEKWRRDLKIAGVS